MKSITKEDRIKQYLANRKYTEHDDAAKRIEPGRIIASVFRDMMVFGVITDHLYFSDLLYRCFPSPNTFTLFHAHEQHEGIGRTKSNFNGKSYCFQSIDDLQSGIMYSLVQAMPTSGADPTKEACTLCIPPDILEQARSLVPELKKLVAIEREFYGYRSAVDLRESLTSYNPHSQLAGVFTKRRPSSSSAVPGTVTQKRKRQSNSSNSSPTKKKRANIIPSDFEPGLFALKHEKQHITLQKLIHESHFALIYECTLNNNNNKEVYILKQYIYDRRNKQSRRRAFINEVNLMFKHCACNPRLVNFRGYVYEENGFWGIITSKYDTSLEQFLKTRRTYSLAALPENLAIRIGFQIADALKFLHTAEPAVYHRDIKPGNVLLNNNAGEENTYTKLEAVLCDMGISCELESSSSITSSEGTHVYMAPEAIDRSKPADIRADIYSFGCLLYEMITGKRPWYGNVNDQIILNAMKDGRLPGKLEAVKNEKLRTLIAHCWQFNASDRPTIAAVVEQLIDCVGVDVIDKQNRRDILDFFKNKYDSSLTLHNVRGGIQLLPLKGRPTVEELGKNLKCLLKTKFVSQQRQLLRDVIVSRRYIKGITRLKDLRHPQLKHKWTENVIYAMQHTESRTGYVGQTSKYWMCRICDHMKASHLYESRERNYQEKRASDMVNLGYVKSCTEKLKPKPLTLIDSTIGNVGTDWAAVPLCGFDTKEEANQLEVLLILLLNTYYNNGLGMGYNVSSGGSWDSTKCIKNPASIP